MNIWFAYLAGLGTIPLVAAVVLAWVGVAEYRESVRMAATRKRDRERNDRSLAA